VRRAEASGQYRTVADKNKGRNADATGITPPLAGRLRTRTERAHPDVFTTGVALPLMGKEFALGATEKGVVAASSLFGILIGATLLGGLADRYGRKQMFIAEMVLFGIFTAILALSPSYVIAVAALVGIGVALGCDYPTAHLIISESIPSRIRGRMVLAAFGFQAVGGLLGTAVGFLILFERVGASACFDSFPVVAARSH
jgi:MFS family permease